MSQPRSGVGKGPVPRRPIRRAAVGDVGSLLLIYSRVSRNYRTIAAMQPKHQALPSSSGILAIFTAILRTSSRVSGLAAARGGKRRSVIVRPVVGDGRWSIRISCWVGGGCRCRTLQRITNSSSVRKKFPTSVCRHSTSSTRKTVQHLWLDLKKSLGAAVADVAAADAASALADAASTPFTAADAVGEAVGAVVGVGAAAMRGTLPLVVDATLNCSSVVRTGRVQSRQGAEVMSPRAVTTTH
jgi:hypothetical protein